MVLDTNAIAIISKELKSQKKQTEEKRSVLTSTELTLRQLYGPVTESAAEKAAKDDKKKKKVSSKDDGEEQAAAEEKPEPEVAVGRDKFMASCREVAKEDGMTDEDAIFTKCDNAWADYLEQQGNNAREAVKSTIHKDEEGDGEEDKKNVKKKGGAMDVDMPTTTTTDATTQRTITMDECMTYCQENLNLNEQRARAACNIVKNQGGISG
jgi:hypothetical protein